MRQITPPHPQPMPSLPVREVLPQARRRADRFVFAGTGAAVVVTAAVLRVAGGTAAVQTFATVFLGIFIEAMPFVVVGVLVSGCIGVFVSDKTVMRLLPRHRIAGPLVGTLLGLLFPVCECGVVPVTRRLLNKGAPVGVGVAFLLASPVVNPIVLWSTWAAFGGDWRMVAWRAGLTLAIAAAVGIAFACHPHPETLLKAAPEAMGYAPAPVVIAEFGRGRGARLSPATTERDLRDASWGAKLRAVGEHSALEFFEMGKFLVIGGLLASAMQTAIPRQALLGIGQSPVRGVLVMIALAVLLSVCSTVDAFLVLTFAGTFTTGAILAFLVFGPMVDIKSTLMFLTVFNRRAVAIMVVLAAQLVLLATVAINLNVS